MLAAGQDLGQFDDIALLSLPFTVAADAIKAGSVPGNLIAINYFSFGRIAKVKARVTSFRKLRTFNRVKPLRR